MDDLDLDLGQVVQMFAENQTEPFLIFSVDASTAEGWAKELGLAVRRCYISDESLAEHAARLDVKQTEIIASRIPDRGSTMAGDTGEIVTALFLAARAHPSRVRDPKKWRLKQDRTKPAPQSDVVQFLVPQWPSASDADALVCAEVKTKSTKSASSPVAKAITDSKKDQEGRLVKTLQWLRERSMTEDLGTVDDALIDRFLKPIEHPPARHDFKAVVVICSTLVEDELKSMTAPLPDKAALVVISVDQLKDHYEALYQAVAAATAPESGQ